MNYSKEEKELIFEFLRGLGKDRIAEFLVSSGLKKSGKKSDLVDRVAEAIEDENVRYADVVRYLDSIAPWGKQHVYLLRGPEGNVDKWRDATKLRKALSKERIANLLDRSLPLILPKEMKLSSISLSDKALRVTAVVRHASRQRREDLDRIGTTPDGKQVVYKAYVEEVRRTLVALEWAFASNSAFLQITQIPADSEYDNLRKVFAGLLKKWLDLSVFSDCDLRLAVKGLRAAEKMGKPEARAYSIKAKSPGGRTLEGRSPSSDSPLTGEASIDAAFDDLLQRGSGDVGNLYWLPGTGTNQNPLTDETHVIVVAGKGRINFPKAQSEDVVRYVLSRVRTHC